VQYPDYPFRDNNALYRFDGDDISPEDLSPATASQTPAASSSGTPTVNALPSCLVAVAAAAAAVLHYQPAT